LTTKKKKKKANTCKHRKKLVTGSDHANVQYVKDTMALQEDESNLMHPDLAAATRQKPDSAVCRMCGKR